MKKGIKEIIPTPEEKAQYLEYVFSYDTKELTEREKEIHYTMVNFIYDVLTQITQEEDTEETIIKSYKQFKGLIEHDRS